MAKGLLPHERRWCLSLIWRRVLTLARRWGRGRGVSILSPGGHRSGGMRRYGMFEGEHGGRGAEDKQRP